MFSNCIDRFGHEKREKQQQQQQHKKKQGKNGDIPSIQDLFIPTLPPSGLYCT